MSQVPTSMQELCSNSKYKALASIIKCCYVAAAAAGTEPSLAASSRAGHCYFLCCCLHVMFHLTRTSQFAASVTFPNLHNLLIFCSALCHLAALLFLDWHSFFFWLWSWQVSFSLSFLMGIIFYFGYTFPCNWLDKLQYFGTYKRLFIVLLCAKFTNYSGTIVKGNFLTSDMVMDLCVRVSASPLLVSVIIFLLVLFLVT